MKARWRPDVALNSDMQRRFYPFSRLSGPANVLVMPGLQSANLSAKLLRSWAAKACSGPSCSGMELPVQIAPMTATASDLVTLAVLAAGGADGSGREASLDPLDRADRVGGAQRRDDRVEVGEVVHFDVEVEGVEAAVAVDQLPG